MDPSVLVADTDERALDAVAEAARAKLGRALSDAEGGRVRGGSMMWYGPGGGGAGWVFMAFMMLVFWGLLVVLVVWLVRSTKPHQGGGEGQARSNALAILEERFARGEIDREEFEQRRAALQGRGPAQ